MTVQSVTIGADPDVLKAGISDGSFFLFRLSDLPPGTSVPVCGLELSAETEAAYRNASRTFSAEISALRLVAIREHSRYLLALKLRKRGYEEAPIRDVLDRLEALKLLDDGRFSEMWVESRLALHDEGPARLLAGLLSRGVARETAESAIRNSVTVDAELASARRFIEKRRIDIVGKEWEARRKLRAAGFSGKTIRALFSDAEGDRS